MNSGKIRFCALLVFASLVANAAGQEIGPQNGMLLLAGGGVRDMEIYKTFLSHAGGADSRIIVIPTAGGRSEYSDDWRGLTAFRRAGATNLQLLHTYDPAVADTPEFAQAIDSAQGVWFSGGRQWRLADAYLNTRVHSALNALLDRGGIIGGTSAGATIQGSYLARGDTKTNTIMMGDHEEGLAFLKNTAVDQHLLRRNRQFDLLEIIRARPDLLGIGLDEDTAILVRGDRFDVIGNGYVAIYDINRKLDSGGLFYFLAPGDSYNLKTRIATGSRPNRQPMERVVDEDWQENHD